MNVTLFKNGMFVDVIALCWGHNGSGWAPNPVPGVFTREKSETFEHWHMDETLKEEGRVIINED